LRAGAQEASQRQEAQQYQRAPSLSPNVKRRSSTSERRRSALLILVTGCHTIRDPQDREAFISRLGVPGGGAPLLRVVIEGATQIPRHLAVYCRLHYAKEARKMSARLPRRKDAVVDHDRTE
jgi:hypothetical protein